MTRKSSPLPGKRIRNRIKRSPRRLRLALVGCGGMGQHHARSLLGISEVQVVALCDIIKSRCLSFCKQFFGPKGFKPSVYTDFYKMIARESLDAVLLVTPHALHYPHAKAALQKGIHVLSEKPMVTDAAQARELVALAESRQRLLAIAFQAPVSAEFAYIAELIRSGTLGRIELVDAHVAQRWKTFTKGTWRQDPKLSGGGQLYDSGAHMFNAMMWLVNSPVKRVFAMADRCGTKVDINGTVSLVFENGCLGSVACSGNATVPGDTGVTLFATEGTIKTGIWGEKLEHFDKAGNKILYPYVPYKTVPPERNFVDAILGRDTLRCPGRYGILLAELMDAIYESIKTGHPVDVRH
ncbi:MAG TPA: Gfo/Idh/MocA family oxidoreductase [Phycisphaerae bacterium]|nr:Gfo/Idh/MocA family oxidoreductase [Phycisphaerae bacterium]HRR87026.1 Gfo/Idh/MocA family oxidoreductase [Phycisphaerae bacterium]